MNGSTCITRYILAYTVGLFLLSPAAHAAEKFIHQKIPISIKTYEPSDSILTLAHGLTLNARHLPVNATPKLILNTQNALLRKLVSSASKSQKATLRKQKRAIARNKKLTQGDRVWTNALMIDSLLKNDSSLHATTLRKLNFTLLSKYGTLIGRPLNLANLEKNIPPKFVSKDLIIIPFPPGWFHLLKIKLDVIAYNKRCKDAGVPVPPAFGDPHWVNKGSFGAAHSFLNPQGLNPHQLSTIYSYSSPKGLCLALPIIQDTVAMPGTWNALGIICQSISTTSNHNISNSKACFWDNNGDIPVLAPGHTHALSSGYFIAPPDLPANNICTDCHAGENPFNIHPGTPLQTAKEDYNNSHSHIFTSRNNWYTPLVDADWPQNPEAKPYPNGNHMCTTCHNAHYAGRLPNVAEGATSTPSGVAGGWPARDNLYKFCNFMLPNVLTAGPPTGTMYGYVHGNATLESNAATLFDKCASLFPTFPASPALPTTKAAWTQSHVSPP